MKEEGRDERVTYDSAGHRHNSMLRSFAKRSRHFYVNRFISSTHVRRFVYRRLKRLLISTCYFGYLVDVR